MDGPESGELVLRHVDLRALCETGLAQRLAEEVGSVALQAGRVSADRSGPARQTYVERLVTRGGPADRGIRDFVGFGELFCYEVFKVSFDFFAREKIDVPFLF